MYIFNPVFKQPQKPDHCVSGFHWPLNTGLESDGQTKHMISLTNGIPDTKSPVSDVAGFRVSGIQIINVKNTFGTNSI